MSVILAIDTTTRGGSVAVARGNDVRAVVHHDPATGYAEALFDLTARACEQASLGLDAIDGVAVVRGPGSFTGLRIGIMTAKTLAYARRWQLWAADSLPLLAAAADEAPQPRVALLDAGRDHVYAGAYLPGRILVEPARVPLTGVESWAASLEPAWSLVVEASLQTQVRQAMPTRRVEMVESLAAPLARLAASASAPAERVEPDRLIPLYLSASQAERTHGLDLRDEVHRPVPPTGWE